MAFTKVGESEVLLTSNSLSNINISEKISYVLSVKSDISALEKGFFRFTLKLANGGTVFAYLFDIKDFISKGFTAFSLKGKFVKISGATGHVGDLTTIVLNSIEVVMPSDVPNRGKEFIGEVNDVNSTFEELKSVAERVDVYLPVYMCTNGYSSVYNGSIGGLTKLASNVMYNIMVHCESEEEQSSILKVFFKSLISYTSFLDRLDKTEIITYGDKIELLKSLPSNDDVDFIVIDTVSSLIGLSSPEHLYSHIINECFKQSLNVMKLRQKWDQLPGGGVLKLEDGGVIKRY